MSVPFHASFPEALRSVATIEAVLALDADGARRLGRQLTLTGGEPNSPSGRDHFSVISQALGRASIAEAMARAVWAANPTPSARLTLVTRVPAFLEGPWALAPDFSTDLCWALGEMEPARMGITVQRRFASQVWRRLYVVTPASWWAAAAGVLTSHRRDRTPAGDFYSCTEMLASYLGSGRPVPAAGILPFLEADNPALRTWAITHLAPAVRDGTPVLERDDPVAAAPDPDPEVIAVVRPVAPPPAVSPRGARGRG